MGSPKRFDAGVETGSTGEEDVEEVRALLLGRKGKRLLTDFGIDAIALGELEEEDGEVVWKRR